MRLAYLMGAIGISINYVDDCPFIFFRPDELFINLMNKGMMDLMRHQVIKP